MIYVLIAAGVIAAAGGLFGAWEHHSVQTAEAKLGECSATLKQQNDAITATKAEGDKRVAEATKGIARAAQATQAARTEAERLRVLQGQPTPAGACPAGKAVAEIRKGLKP